MCSRSPWARKPHTAMVTPSLAACAQMEKRGDSTFGRVGSQHPEPRPSAQGWGTLEGGPGAAKAVAGIKPVVGSLRRAGCCS